MYVPTIQYSLWIEFSTITDWLVIILGLTRCLLCTNLRYFNEWVYNLLTISYFILDSVACPELIMLCQLYGREMLDRTMYLTRTWVFAIHKHKMILLGRLPENKTMGKRSANATNDCPCLRAPAPTMHPPDNTHSNLSSNTLTFSGSGQAAATQDLYLDTAHDVVPAHQAEVQPQVLHYDKPHNQVHTYLNSNLHIKWVCIFLRVSGDKYLEIFNKIGRSFYHTLWLTLLDVGVWIKILGPNIFFLKSDAMKI